MEMNVQLHTTGHFSLVKNAVVTYLVGSWVEPRAGLEELWTKKYFVPAEKKP
jgi:hypothetical protein